MDSTIHVDSDHCRHKPPFMPQPSLHDVQMLKPSATLTETLILKRESVCHVAASNGQSNRSNSGQAFKGWSNIVYFGQRWSKSKIKGIELEIG